MEDFLPAEEYNALPHIDDMRDAPEQHAVALQSLLDLIKYHGLEEEVSVHLLHKHFDAPAGNIMVYETKAALQHPTMYISFGPRKVENAHGVRGLHYQARSSGEMRAYEYTQDAGQNASAYLRFMSVFSRTCFELGVERVFALTVRRPSTTVFTEIENPASGSTILIPESMFLPDKSGNTSTQTDWSAVSRHKLSGVVELECITTRVSKRYIQTCVRTRNGKHYTHEDAF